MPDSAYILETTAPPSGHCVVPLRLLSAADADRAGTACAMIGEMSRALRDFPRAVPAGFALTVESWGVFARGTGFDVQMGSCFAALDAEDMRAADVASALRNAIMAAEFPRPLRCAISEAYSAIGGEVITVAASPLGGETAVTGSAARFANLRGEEALLEALRRCYAELFTEYAIKRRAARGQAHVSAATAVAVQRLVRADLGAAGTLHTDTLSAGTRKVRIVGRWGLAARAEPAEGEADTFVIMLPSLDGTPADALIRKRRGAKRRKMVYAATPNRTRSVSTPRAERERFVLSDAEALKLASWGALVEAHFGRPMTIDWARDGVSGFLQVTDARPQGVSRWPAAALPRQPRHAGDGYT